jgi:hypothetical protein
MTKNISAASLLSAITFAGFLVAAPAQAGSHDVPPGATTRIDVADRSGYTTITVLNTGNAAGSLQLPAGGSTVTVPANGRVELYDRYDSGGAGNYVPVTNTGGVPLRVITRYTARVQLP